MAQGNSYEDGAGKDYNIVSTGYDLMFLNDDDHDKLNGINLQIVHGFKLLKVPLFLETGIGITYNTCKYIAGVSFEELNTEEETKRLNSLTIYIPLHLGYKFTVNESFGIMPYTGFSWKFNPIFNYNFKSENEYFSLSQRSNINISNFGWDIGLKFFISKLFLGVQYGLDIMRKGQIIYNQKILTTLPLEYSNFRDISFKDN